MHGVVCGNRVLFHLGIVFHCFPRRLKSVCAEKAVGKRANEQPGGNRKLPHAMLAFPGHGSDQLWFFSACGQIARKRGSTV